MALALVLPCMHRRQDVGGTITGWPLVVLLRWGDGAHGDTMYLHVLSTAAHRLEGRLSLAWAARTSTCRCCDALVMSSSRRHAPAFSDGGLADCGWDPLDSTNRPAGTNVNISPAARLGEADISCN